VRALMMAVKLSSFIVGYSNATQRSTCANQEELGVESIAPLQNA
jgi:hypothetical protein